MKHYFKNNKGMTYVELLVAFTLLVLIVFAFSPMILQSYDFLYKAGEMNINTYDAKSSMEERLATRENDPFYNINMNFKGMNDQFEIKARQVFTEIQDDARGLVTLYTNPPVRIQIKSDTTIFDDYENKAIAIKFINFPSGRVIFGDATKAVDGAVAPDGKYVVSLELTEAITNDNVPATLETKLVGGNINEKKPDALLYFNAIDITHTPLRLVAHYYNEYGQLKLTETYLHIKPANIMFVGKTSGTASYYSSAGANDDGSLIISNRTMPSAAIPSGITLNDVSWISPEEDSTYGEGYYMMCGENSTVRRLWHLTENTAAGREALFSYEEDSEVINSKRYYKYKWAYDYGDSYSYNISHNGSDGLYNSGKNMKATGSYNQFYFAKGFNGDTSKYENLNSNTVRISYVQTSTEEAATAAGYTYIKPYYSVWTEIGNTGVYCNGIAKSGETQDGERRNVYDPTDNTWKRISSYTIFYPYPQSFSTISGTSSPFTYQTWVNGDQKFTMGIDTARFSNRNGIVESWTFDQSGLSGGQKDDEKLAYLFLKCYNNFDRSNQYLFARNQEAAAAPTTNKVNLKSAAVLPGSSGKGIYFGTTKANAVITQTNAYGAGDLAGTVSQYIIFGEDSGTSIYDYTQVPQTINAGGATFSSPDFWYGISSYQSGKAASRNLSTTNLLFTMGYCSNLSILYDTLDYLPAHKVFEKIYFSSKGISSPAAEDYKNVWLPREFMNIVSSANYGQSVVAVGYNVSGYSKLQYNYTYLPGEGSSSQYKVAYKDFSWGPLMKYNNGETAYGYVFNPPTNASGWGTIKSGGNVFGKNYVERYKYWKGEVSKDYPFWVVAPRAVVASTALDKLTNDGVMSVYNAGDASFTNIYYYKAPGQQSARFNCVAIGEASATQLNAFIGASNSQLIVVPLGYSNGKIATTPILDKNCTKIAMPDVQSVDAVEVSDSYVFAGGKNTSGSKESVLYYSDNGGKTFSKVSLPNTAGYDVTSIAAAKEYVYVVASNGTNSVVCYAKLNKAGAAGQWRTQSKYQTNVTYSMDDGTPISNSSTLAQLPLIKAVATQN